MLKDNQKSVLLLSKDASLIKPVTSFEKLLGIIRDKDEVVTFEQQEFVYFSEGKDNHYVYFVIDGNFKILRDPDGMCIVADCAPFIFGTSIMLQGLHASSYAIIPEEKCRVYRVPCEEAKRRINIFNLWYDVADILAYIIQVFIRRDKYLAGVDAYTMIKFFLMRINELDPEERMCINVEKFIHQHTHLSRSGIMKILSALRVGGYITMERGCLVEINNLPKSY